VGAGDATAGGHMGRAPPSRYTAGMASDEASLELLRAASGLSIDPEGRFLHRGEPITHARTLEVLWRSLHRDATGRWRVAIGREQGYVQVDETPWVIRAVELDGDRAVLRLAGGREEPLDPATLAVAPDGVLRCRVREGERARFSRGAQIALGLALEEDPAGTGRWVLALGGARWAVAGEAPP
jgi:hypothetical protein